MNEVLYCVSSNERTQILECIPNRYCCRINNVLNKFVSFSSYIPVIKDILSKTNLMVMIDDPIISTNLAELLLQVQSGLTMGSRNACMQA